MVNAQKYIDENETIRRVSRQEETVWINPDYLPVEVTDGLCQLVVSDEDIADADGPADPVCLLHPPLLPGDRSHRRPDRIAAGGHSPDAAGAGAGIRLHHSRPADAEDGQSSGHCRLGEGPGGIYEVLKHAEDLAIAAGKLTMEDDYAKLAEPEMKQFFGRYTVQVGSTGNLGMSIGIPMSAALGFRVKVQYVCGCQAVEEGSAAQPRSGGAGIHRRLFQGSGRGPPPLHADPMSYFVDDEKSVNLFLGYAVAAKRLKQQLDEQGITVDTAHPLVVYLPTGVGGAPGGIAYGLKRLFKNNVHCFLVEPTLCPSVLLGMATKQYEKANVRDFGLSWPHPHADGLACAAPSGFFRDRILGNLVSGDFTVEDARLYDDLRLLDSSEGKRIEPSSCAAFAGPRGLLTLEDSRRDRAEEGLTEEVLANSVQIAWATGGRLVPAEVWEQYLATHLN